MKTVKQALELITGYLISIKRNTVNGWYELEIGMPNKWVFDENSEVSCEVLKEGTAGKLIKISPKNNNIDIDDLISFVEFIIETNRKIAEKEEELNKKLEEMKSKMEDVTKSFLTELDDLRDKSFKKLSQSSIKGNSDKEPKIRKPRTTSDTKHNTTEIENVEQNDVEIPSNN